MKQEARRLWRLYVGSLSLEDRVKVSRAKATEFLFTARQDVKPSAIFDGWACYDRAAGGLDDLRAVAEVEETTPFVGVTTPEFVEVDNMKAADDLARESAAEVLIAIRAAGGPQCRASLHRQAKPQRQR
jgi:hypothetical protein